MKRSPLRTLPLFLLLQMIVLPPIPKTFAQTQARASDREIEALRSRVLELEKQSAEILDQLSRIQQLLEQTISRESSEAEGVQVAAIRTGPASSVTRALEVAPVPNSIPQPPSQPQAPIVRAEGNDSKIGFYGFVRVDAIFDDSKNNAFQAPTFVRSEPAGTENQGNFTIHPRLSRFGMNFYAPTALMNLGDARLRGRIETDFLNGGSESRAIPRMRHAYLRLDWGEHSLLAGQTSDLISPLFPTVNSSTLMWNAGNLGDRRMQIRYGYEAKSGLSFRAGIGMTGAVDPLDADANGIRDGEAAIFPNFQGRIAYDSQRVKIGAWSHYARLHTGVAFGGQNDFNGYSYGSDFEFLFMDRLRVRGEAWAGSNLGDLRGGIGQSFNRMTGQEIDSRGGWVEVGVHAGRHDIFAGYSMDDPKNQHVAAGSPTENRAWYITNRFSLSEPLVLGIENLHWRTHFKGFPKGTDNRINVYLIYGF